MQLQHDFTVPVPLDQAWEVLLDLERVAPCMPGATLASVDGDTFTGKVRVKVGPIQVTYQGSGHFTEKDESTRRAVIEASAREMRGSGTAKATVTALLCDAGDTTRVEVTTDLAITGRPAQFGRSVMSEVGAKLIGRFADCLAAEILAGSGAPADETAIGAGAADPEPASDPAHATAAAAAGPESGSRAQGAAGPIASTSSRGASPAASEPASPEPAASEPAARVSGSADGPAPAVGSARTASAAATSTGSGRTTPQHRRPEAEAIDLLDVAGASVAKRALPAAVGLGVLVAVVVWRRRHS